MFLSFFPNKIILEHCPNKADITKCSHENISKKHKKICYAKVLCVLFRVLCTSHDWHTYCVQKVSSTKCASQWCKCCIVKNYRPNCMFVSPVSLKILIRSSKLIGCGISAIDSNSYHKKDEYRYENGTQATKSHKSTDIVITTG